MSTTPDWLLVVVAVIAALGGAAMGAIINQLGSSRQATTAWNREQERMAEERAHEVRARTFEQRTSAYVELIQALQSADEAVHRAMRAGQHTMADAHHDAVKQKMAAVQIFGSDEVAGLGWNAWSRLLIFEIGLGQGVSSHDERQDDGATLTKAIADLVEAVRADLGVEPVPEPTRRLSSS